MGSHRVGHNWNDLAAATAAGISQRKCQGIKPLKEILEVKFLKDFERFWNSFFNIYADNKITGFLTFKMICEILIKLLANCQASLWCRKTPLPTIIIKCKGQALKISKTVNTQMTRCLVYPAVKICKIITVKIIK